MLPFNPCDFTSHIYILYIPSLPVLLPPQMPNQDSTDLVTPEVNAGAAPPQEVSVYTLCVKCMMYIFIHLRFFFFFSSYVFSSFSFFFFFFSPSRTAVMCVGVCWCLFPLLSNLYLPAVQPDLAGYRCLFVLPALPSPSLRSLLFLEIS